MANKTGKSGPRPKPPAGDTPLYERCDRCREGEPMTDHICTNGFVQTGYTTERLDRMQGEIDKLLLLLCDVDTMLEEGKDAAVGTGEVPTRRKIRDLLLSRITELEGARSRTRAVHGR